MVRWRVPIKFLLTPLEIIHKETLIDEESGDYLPTSDQVNFWESSTCDVRDHGALTTIRYPACNRSNGYRGSTPRNGGQGFAETGFYHECSACGFAITRDTLATMKFVDDLAAAQASQHLSIAYVGFNAQDFQ